MPPSLLAALRYTPSMQSVLRLGLVVDCAHSPGATGSKFDHPHFGHDRSIFHVGIFGSVEQK